MKTFKQPLSKEAELYYLERSKSGDLEARNILVEYNLRLVAHIVKKYNTTERDTDDLISIGTIGLIKAINTFDLNKGSRLVTYASRCIENELLMMLRQERKCSKEFSLYEPIGTDKEGNEISLLDIIENNQTDISEHISLEEDISHLHASIKKDLDQRETEILILRYGLFGQKPLTQREIAQRMNISRSYISRIEKKALQKLKKSISGTSSQNSTDRKPHS